MTVKEIVEAYADELGRWDFFSDGQRAYINSSKHIIVCLRNYNWYATKYPIRTTMDAIKALFEIDWIAEYEDEGNSDFISSSKYWIKY